MTEKHGSAAVTLLDGGMGEELRARSRAGEHPLWSAQVMIEAPDLVRAVHRDFIAAGARVITANSYSTIRRKLAEAGIEERFAELNRAAGRLAEEARDEAHEAGASGGAPVRIAGALPPLHGSYRPERIRPADEIEPAYREQAELLAPHVDLFLCETMASAAEARAAAAGAAATGKPVWVAWTLADEGSRLRSGESLAEAAAALDDLPVEGFLVNCCAPESVTEAMPELVRLANGRVAGGYANGFAHIPADWSVDQGVGQLGAREDLGPDDYVEHVAGWIAHGATLAGGCCRIGPAHIARIADHLAAR